MNTPSKLALGLAALVLVAYIVPVNADHQPADKAAVSGSALEFLGTEAIDGTTADAVTLLTSTVKTSSPTDLLFQVTAECAIWTDVTTVGNDDQTAGAQVLVWIEVDGVPVGVVGGDDGKVVFCDRVHQSVTSLFDDEDATTRTYQAARSANAFNWMRLNLGNGEHLVEVKAELSASATANAAAKAAVGKRTLVIEPTKLANDVDL